jgi:hypothetical protein
LFPGALTKGLPPLPKNVQGQQKPGDTGYFGKNRQAPTENGKQVNFFAPSFPLFIFKPRHIQ